MNSLSELSNMYFEQCEKVTVYGTITKSIYEALKELDAGEIALTDFMQTVRFEMAQYEIFKEQENGKKLEH